MSDMHEERYDTYMMSFQIKNVKNFMSRFLASETFDSFLLSEAAITTYNHFFIDGKQNKDFYTEEEWEDKTVHAYDYSLWKDMKALCFHLIKGTHTPVNFKFVLHLLPERTETVLAEDSVTVPPSQVKALVLTVKYDTNGLFLTTGTSLHTFLADKSADVAWDNYMKAFLAKADLDYETPL